MTKNFIDKFSSDRFRIFLSLATLKKHSICVSLTFFVSLLLNINSSLADQSGSQAPEVAIAPVGPQTHAGTGLLYANAACPFRQTTIPNQVILRAERLRNAAVEIDKQLQLKIKRQDEIRNGDLFAGCEKYVNKAIENACSEGKRALGRRWISKFEDHMLGESNSYNPFADEDELEIDESFPSSKNTNYLIEYMYALNFFRSSSPNVDRTLAGGGPIIPPAPVVVLEEEETGCNKFKRANGRIDSALCYAAGSESPKSQDKCEFCLKPQGGYPNGIWPTLFVDNFILGQEIAILQGQYTVAIGKAECVTRFIDNAPATGPDSAGFQNCIKIVDPLATAADFCLFCDEVGLATVEKRPFEWGRWLPSILTAGLWIAGGIYANNQMEETREGNWEAGYPSDDRSPWVMSSYIGLGANSVINSLQAAGAFGCAPGVGVGGAPLTATLGVGGMVQGFMGAGGPMVQTGGALGYDPSITGQLTGNLNGGLFPNAQLGGYAGAGVNVDQARYNLQNQIDAANAAILRNQQGQAQLDQYMQVQAAYNQARQQEEALRYQLQNQAQGLAPYINTGAIGVGGAGVGFPGVGLNGLGTTGAGLRIGLDVNGWAGVGAGVNGNLYGSGAPGTAFPPYPVNNNGMPNGSWNDDYYDDGNSSPGSIMGLPGVGR